MTIADDIISHHMPDFDHYIAQGELLDDLDEYGFTPLIEAAITKQPFIAEKLLERKVDVNKPDLAGRSALHWAVDNHDLDMVELLLTKGANPNAYSSSGLSILVFPVLREQNDLKHLLYKYGAKLDFAYDFIYAKLLGHRYELHGDVDIFNTDNQFIEVKYEGFILEFTISILEDSIRRFTSSYSTRYYRKYFPYLHTLMDAFSASSELLRLQPQLKRTKSDLDNIEKIISQPMVVLPAATTGHAIGFMRYNNLWAKIDRGENSLKEGCVNIFKMTKPANFSVKFIEEFMYKKQPMNYFHKTINQKLGLQLITKIPLAPQIAGNCSWANIQALVLVGYFLQTFNIAKISYKESREIYDKWIEWDKDRALDECTQRFYLVNSTQKVSYVSMLAAVMFQSLDYADPYDIKRAEKIINILTLPEYYYILESYLEIYCVKSLTRKGNNLLKILEELGFNPNIGVTPVATGLIAREER